MNDDPLKCAPLCTFSSREDAARTQNVDSLLKQIKL